MAEAVAPAEAAVITKLAGLSQQNESGPPSDPRRAEAAKALDQRLTAINASDTKDDGSEDGGQDTVEEAIKSRVELWNSEHPGHEISAPDLDMLKETVRAGLQSNAKNGNENRSMPNDAVDIMGAARSADSQTTPETENQQPESPEVAQRRIDTIHTLEVMQISSAILKRKTTEINVDGPVTLCTEHLIKYKNIMDLLQAGDGATQYQKMDGTKLDYVPLNISSDKEAPYIQPITVDGKPTFIAASFSNAESIQVVRILSKQGDTVTCLSNNGETVAGIPITSLALAQEHSVVNAPGADSTFSQHEFAVLKAHDTAIQNQDETAFQKLYSDEATDIKEAARNNGFISADSVRTYLDKIYEEITPEPGMELTDKEKAHNSAVRRQKEAVIRSLNLDARTIADEHVMIGLVTQTHEATMAGLAKAIEAAPTEQAKEILRETLKTLSDPESQKQFPGIMTEIMKEMSPEFAQDMNNCLEKGDMAGVYQKLIEKFPAAKDQIENVKSKLGEKIVIGGLGLFALLAALLTTAAAAGMRPAR